MIDTKELRRLAQAATPGPWILLPVGDKSKCFAVADINLLSVLTVVDECGTSFGAVYLDGDAKFIAAANPAAINELLDRLEEAESDCVEQALLLGMGSEREAALMAKLEAAEKERNALHARIKEMERQEPVGSVELDEIKIALHRALELGKRETWTGAKKYRSREDQREEQQCWDKVWTLLSAKGE